MSQFRVEVRTFRRKPTGRLPPGLVALALGGFGIGLTEFLIAGLLPQVASDFAVSEAAAGRLISGYALSVAVGAIVLTAATARLPRKWVLLGLVALFVIGNLLCAVAPDYPVMMLGRIVAALCHGSFFGIGSLVARGLVAPERKSRAVAVMFAGLTLANVLGVPFGALVGERWGWRSAFWAVTAVGVLALAGIAALVPTAARGDGAEPAPTAARGDGAEPAPTAAGEGRAEPVLRAVGGDGVEPVPTAVGEGRAEPVLRAAGGDGVEPVLRAAGGDGVEPVLRAAGGDGVEPVLRAAGGDGVEPVLRAAGGDGVEPVPTAAGEGRAEPVPPIGLRDQLRAFRSWQVWLTLTATALGYGGMFGAFSYLAYTFTEVGGFSAADVAWLLMVYGVGLVVGNVVGGRAADRDRDRTLMLALLGLAVTLAAFGLLAANAPACVVLVFLMGLTGFAAVPGMITRVTDHAHGAALAAGANVSASNVGNALGAWLGGLALSAGLGYRAPLFVGSGIVAVSVVVMAVAAYANRLREIP
ncbi:MFS transporter [Streptomyces sp. NBC_00663]|uniref:MFS transporter n=1 Tax=Streptomyces sp. NBC_00663 TaxID=2975801 RepID=UPI002E2FD1A7|nr:MFS transporter [Streptomyces sp. NBC_00663]